MYRLLFKFQLGIVGHVLPFATPAGTKMLAEMPRCGILMVELRRVIFTFAKVLFAFINFNICNITRDGFFYKQNKIVGFANTFAFFGYINNRYVLKNFIYPWFARSTIRMQR
jgi:hypothetical protein